MSCLRIMLRSCVIPCSACLSAMCYIYVALYLYTHNIHVQGFREKGRREECCMGIYCLHVCLIKLPYKHTQSQCHLCVAIYIAVGVCLTLMR